MPIETNLNVAPYFDDFDSTKDYYKVLFRPGVALQARELTQLQSILQNQIEKFGDNVFKSGTVISGVNFQYNYKYDYVKLLDLQVDGQPINPAGYVGLLVKNSANLVAKIVNYKSGFQSRDPDISYIYLKYTNAGDTGGLLSFSSDDVLTVYSDSYKLYDYDVINGGVGFSNSDTVQITSALIVENSTIGSGASVTQTIGSNTSSVFVLESNNTFGTITVGSTNYSSGAGYTLLKVRPIISDLSDQSKTADRWNIRAGYSIIQGSNTATVVAKVGSGATATLTTDGSGIITDVSVVSAGNDYDIIPNVTVRTATGVLTNLNILPQNYKAQVTVASNTFTAGNTTPVGNGYAFAVTEGIIYQKGHFIRVDPQVVIVNAYSGNVDGVSVGFETIESIVNSNADDTLLDLATGTPNFAAPGANRLKLTPTLKVVNTSSVEANNTFMPLVEFREGSAGKEYSSTQYNVIAKEMERRTDDITGSYVIDPFVITTKDKVVSNSSHVDVVVDPGKAYINGVRVITTQNTIVPLRRGVDTKVTNNRTISLNYGNYILVSEFAGYFDFKSGAQIQLFNTARTYITSGLTSITSTGTQIGTARVRSLVFDSGIPGTATAKYRLYLFDVQMNAGKSFKDVRSVYYSGTPRGIADIVLTTNSITGKSEAILKDNTFNTLVFPSGIKAVKSTNAVSYSYRTSSTGANVSIAGIASVTVSGDDIIGFGANTILNSTQRQDVIIVPQSNGTSNIEYTAGVTNSSSVITGSGLAAGFGVGDYLKITNGSNTLYRQITSVINSTAVGINAAYSNTTNASATLNRHYPANIPISLTSDSVTGNTSSDGKTLNINIGDTFSSLFNVSVSFNVTRENASAITKNIKRNLKVRLSMANNVALTDGPWSLGIPDGFRLNKVYLGANSSVDETGSNVTRYFFLDNGNRDSHYDHSRLTKSYNADFSLSSSDWLLVDFDAYETSSEGFFTASSYITSNTGNTTSLGNTAVNVLEIPEFNSSYGVYYDLRDSIDFRPRTSNTAIYTSNNAAATINPSATITFNTDDKLFPVPDSEYDSVYEQYLSRADIVTLDINNKIKVVEGTSAEFNPVPPVIPAGTMALGIINVPPFPTIPRIPSSNVVNFVAKSTGTVKPINTRSRTYTVGSIAALSSPGITQTRRYTMSDISKIENRLSAVEYYTSLNMLEQQTKDLLIPSGIDGTDRFKNGFFVDQFLDYKQSDVTNSEYNAYIDQNTGALYPPDATYNLQARFDYTDSNVTSDLRSPYTPVEEPGIDAWTDGAVVLPYVEEEIFSQGKFTGLVSGDGTLTRLIGHAVVEPPEFKVLFRADVRVEEPAPAPSSGGRSGGCCVIATELNRIGMWENNTRNELLKWCDNKLTGKFVGEWLKRGYQVVGSKVGVPLLRYEGKHNKYIKKYGEWSFRNGTRMVMGKSFNPLSIPNSLIWISAFMVVGAVVTKEYGDKCWNSLYTDK